jgi:hypothetical protein
LIRPLLLELLRRGRAVRTTPIELPWSRWASSVAARHKRVARAGGASGILLTLPQWHAPRSPGARSEVKLDARIGLALRSFVTFGSPTPARLLAASPGIAPASAAVRVPTPAPRSQLALLRLAGPPDRASAAGVVRELCRETIRRIVEERSRVELPLRLGAATPADPTRAGIDAESAALATPLRPTHQDAWVDRPPEPALRPPQVLPPSHDVRRAVAEALEGRGAAEPPAPQPPAAAPVELDQLTDEVVRQIDRRIVAHRERMGRI